MKKAFIQILAISSLLLTSAFQAQADGGFDSHNTMSHMDGYFDAENRVPEYYRPRVMNPMIAMLPEYSQAGPGYVCDTRQAPPVYRLPLQYYRNVGYREADWFNNRLLDRHHHPMNFGGFDY
jgi:hypothetical protein